MGVWQVEIDFGTVDFTDIEDLKLKLRADFVNTVRLLILSNEIKHMKSKVGKLFDPKNRLRDERVLVLSFSVDSESYRFLFLLNEYDESLLMGCNIREPSKDQLEAILRAFIEKKAHQIVYME
ncbi:MAG: hypothetical protein GOU99_01815 [Candidatus Altiarchaeota archaeon]|nr:hypothetical protein [Candidatus Altiarchaeota archaeon]